MTKYIQSSSATPDKAQKLLEGVEGSKPARIADPSSPTTVRKVGSEVSTEEDSGQGSAYSFPLSPNLMTSHQAHAEGNPPLYAVRTLSMGVMTMVLLFIRQLSRLVALDDLRSLASTASRF
jgi:hypothetical protein